MLGLLLCVLASLNAASVQAATLGEDQCQTENAAFTINPQAEAMITGLVSLRMPGLGGEACGAPHPSIIVSYEAARWALKVINQDSGKVNGNDVTDSYVPGMKIGIHVYDTCAREELAVRSVMDAYPGFSSAESSCTDETQVNLGVLGGTFSHTTKAVASFLHSYHVPQISSSAQSQDLSDNTVYPYFMRTVADTLRMNGVITELMLRLGWKRIAIVYTDNELGREAAEELIYLLLEKEICTSLSMAVKPSGNTDTELKKVLEDLVEADIVGTVYIGTQISPLLRMGQLAPNIPGAGRLQWISSGQVVGITIPYFRGHMAVTPSSRRIPEFQDHLMRIDENNPEENPWFKEWYMMMNQCKLPGTTIEPYNTMPDCVLKTEDEKRQAYVQDPYALSAIDAVFTFARALRDARAAKCPGQPSGSCAALQQMTSEDFFENYLKKVYIMYAKDERIPSWASYREEPYFRPKTTQFTATGDIVNATYDIWNMNNRISSSKYLLEKVGVFQDEKLTLEKDEIIMYDDSRTIALAGIPASDCPRSGCVTCLLGKSDTKFLHIPGNILISGLFPVHSSTRTRICQDLDSYGSQVTEAFAFGVEYAKKKFGVPQGVSIGALGFDNCALSTIAQDLVSGFHSGQLVLRLKDGRQLDSESVHSYVAASSSDTSIAVANLLGPMKMTQVSYGSSSSMLSDRSKYPYFLRTPPSDAKQARAFIEICKHYGWTYVQMLHSASSFGRASAVEIAKLAEIEGICIVATYEVGTDGTHAEIVRKLQKNPQAKAVIATLSTSHYREMLEAIHNANADGQFLIVACANWATNKDIVDGLERTATGTISLQWRLPAIDEFVEYLNSIDVRTYVRNPWFKDYYQEMFECHLEFAKARRFPTACDTSKNITSAAKFALFVESYYTINAATAAVDGLHEALKEICGPSYTTICPEFSTKPDKMDIIFKHTEAAKFKDVAGIDFEFFNREGLGYYEIYNYNGVDYTRLGHYTETGNQLSIHQGMRFYNGIPIASECVTGIACESCLTKFKIKFLHEPGDVYLGGFFNIHYPGRNTYSCGEMKEHNGFQYTEALAWAVDQVNSGNAAVKLNGVKLGAVGLDDCSAPLFAKSLVSGVHSGRVVLTKDGITVPKDKIHSWLSFGSDMSIQIAEVLNALQVAQISPSATTTTLSNTAAYPAFYRTVPADDKQTTGMAKLAAKMEWTCVQTVHEPSTYGRTAVIEFKKAARNERICVSACYELTTDGSYATIMEKLADSSTKGVIVFARSDNYARKLLEAKAKNNNASSLIFVASESWSNMQYVIRGQEQAAENFLSFKVEAPVVNEFDTYMGTLKPEQNARNPWFDEYYQQLFNCYLTNDYVYPTKCNLPGTSVTTNQEYEQENWVLTTIDAVFAYTKALNEVLIEVCGTGYNGVCAAFSADTKIDSKILGKMRAVQFSSRRNENFEFNADHSAKVGYKIYRISQSNYVEVGSYKDDVLVVSDTQLKDRYNIATQCAPCIECPFGQDVLDGEKFSFVDGDLLIAGMFDVHLGGSAPFSCGAVNHKFGAQLVEVFNYAIEEVNKKTGIFQNKLKGISLGGISLDSCKSPVRAASLLAGFHSGRLTLRSPDGKIIDPDRIQTWIGGWDTATSIEMAQVLRVLGLPQVSYGSSGFELKNFKDYPNFLRTVPADDKQVRGMISFLKFWNMINVQVIVSPGSYTERMAEEFHRLAEKNGICETANINFDDESGASPAAADKIIDQVISHKPATTVVAILDSDYLHEFMLAMARNPQANGRFFVLATDAWTNNRELMSDIPQSLLDHSIEFGVETADVPEFDRYLNAKLPDNNDRNPWYREYYQDMWKCTLPGNVISYPDTCTNTDLSVVRSDNYTQDMYTLYVLNSVYATAMGIHHALVHVCGENYNGLCADFRTSGEKHKEILEGMLKTSFIDATLQPFEFDQKNRESTRGYHLFTKSEVTPLTRHTPYQNVGSYNDTHLLKMDIRYDTKWFSNCSGGACADCPNLVPRLSRYMQVRQIRDLGIVNFLDVHKAGNNYLGCGPIDMNAGMIQLMSFFYGLHLVNTNFDSKLDTTMKMSGLLIDICGSHDRLRQDLYTYLNGQGLCNYASYTDLIYPWTVVNYLVHSTSMSEAANEYLTPLGYTSMSETATSSALNNKDLYPYYLRTVPPDSLQAEAIVGILEKFKWDYFIAIYSDAGYGRMGMKNLEDVLKRRKVACLTNKIKISENAALQEAIEVVQAADRYKYARVVLLFTFTDDTRTILQAAQTLGLQGRFTWIGADDWGSRHFITDGLEDIARGAVTIQLRSEPVPGYREWVKEMNLDNRKGIPNDWFEEYWQHMHRCRLPNSIVRQNQYARQCDDTDKITDDMVADDPRILHNIIATYVTAWGLSSERKCYGSSIDDCLWRLERKERNKLIYEAIRAAQWNVLQDELGENSFQFKFTEQGYGDIGYEILNFRLKGSSESEYEYRRIGLWLEELEMNTAQYVGYGSSGEQFSRPPVSTCPQDFNCTCVAGSLNRVETDELSGLLPEPPLTERLQEPYGIVLGLLSAFGAITALILFFYFLIFYPVRGGTSVLGYMLLVGIFLIYLVNFAFLLHARESTCGIRRFCLGIAYAITLASMLVKVLNTWRVDTYTQYQAPYRKLSHPFWLFATASAIAMVEVIINAEWMIISPPQFGYMNYNGQLYPQCSPIGMFYEELLKGSVYVLFLILMVAFFAVLTWRSEENSGESRWILVASFFTGGCWAIWGIVVCIGPMKYHDSGTVIANLFAATVILLSIYARKFYLLHKYKEEEQKEEIYSSVYSHPISHKRNDGIDEVTEEEDREAATKF